MKSILLADNKGTAMNVYPAYVREKMVDTLGLFAEQAFTKAEVLAEPERFADTEYAFSTWSMPVFTEEEIRRCFPRLKAVLYAAGSVQAFARPFLACGVKVFSGWAANAIPVAEMTLAHILLANKGYLRAAQLTSRSADQRDAGHAFGRNNPGNFESRVGIIGVGMIGAQVCRFLKNHRCQVVAFDPFCSAEKAAELGITLVELPELFATCDVISNHLANNAQTKNILDYALFSQMKPYATFINTGRGAQVVEADLQRALAEVPTRTAVLDVTEPEPPAADSPFFGKENMFLTPHLAGSTSNEVWRMAEYMYEEAQALESGAALRYNVTEEMLKTMA